MLGKKKGDFFDKQQKKKGAHSIASIWLGTKEVWGQDHKNAPGVLVVLGIGGGGDGRGLGSGRRRLLLRNFLRGEEGAV